MPECKLAKPNGLLNLTEVRYISKKALRILNWIVKSLRHYCERWKGSLPSLYDLYKVMYNKQLKRIKIRAAAK